MTGPFGTPVDAAGGRPYAARSCAGVRPPTGALPGGVGAFTAPHPADAGPGPGAHAAFSAGIGVGEFAGRARDTFKPSCAV